MGYVLAPEKLMTEFRRVHQFIVFTVNTPFQYALADYMKNKSEYLELGAFLSEKTRLFYQPYKRLQVSNLFLHRVPIFSR